MGGQTPTACSYFLLTITGGLLNGTYMYLQCEKKKQREAQAK